VAIKGFENNITPFTVAFGALPATNDLMHLVHDSLFWSQVKADPEPWLAESAEPSEGGRVWTVKLRDDVRWHDGAPFTAEDVKFSFEYYRDQPGASGRYAHHVGDVPSFDRAEVLDPTTVELIFNEPAPQFKIMPGADLPIVAKHVWEGVTEPADQTEQLPVGTGPFQLVEIVPDQRYRLQANDDYFKGAPTVDELELVIIKDPASAFAALRTGDIDMVERNVPPELVEQFRNSADIELAESTRMESTQLYFNARKAPLTDPALRKAISMAVDVDALVETIILGHGRPGRDSFVHPDSPWAIPDGRHEHDPQQARRLLDDAGYGPAGADGVRTAPDGTPLDFSVLLSSFEPLEIRAVQAVAEQVEQIGVRLRPEPLEPTALRARRQAPPGEAPTYDLYVSNLESHAHADPDGLYYFFHSPGDKGFGGAITGYSNDEFDSLAERATTAEIEERKDLTAQMQAILADEVPAIVMWYPDSQFAYRPAAYDGWVRDPGQGIFTKRSFLPEYVEGATEEAGGAESGADSGSSAFPAVVVVAALAVAGLGAVVLLRRRTGAGDDDE
ncbi:MAG: ABC transporter substrate-binding protein, partial [Actinobacteria bacterium]|nr:ABC transporter substrate-binding protein [Actinomycetota bacterium]